METESISVESPAVNVTTETVDETTSQESNSISQDTGKSSSEKQQPSVEDSEDYETPEPEDENDSVNEEELDEEKGREESGLEDEEEEGSETGSEEGSVEVPIEREEGDGEEESDKKEKPLDHDEDKRDPQYIPKKGNFYEHDDRTSETDEPQPPKKPVAVAKTCDAKERWGHDMYDDDLQTPKSRNELIDQYGYDIRDEEGPPKARRRRRYGRGPNKYTRHWEEEEAYSKSGRGGGASWRGGSGGPRGGRGGGGRPDSRGPPRPQDFPPLPSIMKDDGYENKKEVEVEEPPIPEPPKKKEEEAEKPKVQEPPVAKSEAPPAVTNSPHQHPPQVQRNVYVRKVEMKPQQRHPPGSRSAGGSSSEGFGGSGPSSKIEARMRIRSEDFGPPQPNLGSRGRGRHPASSYRGLSTAEQDIATLSQHFSEAVINVDIKSFGPQRGTSLPPMDSREEKQQRGDKEKNNSEGGRTRQQQQSGMAKSGGEQQSSTAAPEQGSGKSKRYSTQRQRSLPQANLQSHAVNRQLPPPPPPQQQQQRYIQEGYYHGVEGGAPPPVPPPPNFQPPGFTEPLPVMAFIPPLYVPPPPTYLPPPPPIPVQSPRPAEVYQGGGITYYNTQSQVPRPIATSRRIKLAIPIVAPPQESQPSST